MHVYLHQAEDNFVKFSTYPREDCSMPIESINQRDWLLYRFLFKFERKFVKNQKNGFNISCLEIEYKATSCLWIESLRIRIVYLF